MIVSIVELCPVCLHAIGEAFILVLVGGRYMRRHRNCNHERQKENTTIE